jgi:hypothetical protein
MKLWLIFSGVIVALVSCAQAKNITKEDLHSDLLSAISLASETELFIDQIENNRLRPQFRAGHADYLREQAQQQARELRKSTADSGGARIAAFCADQLESLARELALVRARSSDQSLQEIRKRVAAIKNSLSGAKAEQ